MTKKYCNVKNLDSHHNYLNRHQDFFNKLLSNLNQSINKVEGFNHTDFKFDVYYTHEIHKGRTNTMVSRMKLYNDYICFTSIDNDNLANHNYHSLMQIYQWQPISNWKYRYEVDYKYLELSSYLYSIRNKIRIKLGNDLNQFKESDLKAILVLIKKIYNLFFVDDKLQKNQFDWSSISSTTAIDDRNLRDFVVSLDLKNFANSTIYLSNGGWFSPDQLETLLKDVLVSDSPVAKFLNNYKNFKHWLSSNRNNKISL